MLPVGDRLGVDGASWCTYAAGGYSGPIRRHRKRFTLGGGGDGTLGVVISQGPVRVMPW